MQALSTIHSGTFHDLIDYSVVDQSGDSVGTLHSLWADQETGGLEFLGVKTGWLFGSNHVVPTAQAQVDEASRTIQVPYALDLIKGAPAIAADAEITEDQEAEIYRYYGVSGGSHRSSVETDTIRSTTDKTTTTAAAAGLTTGAAAAATRTTHDTAATATTRSAAREARGGETIEVALQEEQLKVGKRRVDAGGVRLRKIVRTETVNTPVELRREEVVVERIPASEMRPGDVKAADFQEKDINVTLHREEAVVAKETVVTGAVRLHKTEETETQNVSDTVRKEDVEVDRTGVTTTETHRDDTKPRR